MRTSIAVALMIVMSTTHIALAFHARAGKVPMLIVTFRVDDHSGLGDRVIDAAIEEARAVWADYGVTLEHALASDVEPCLAINIEQGQLPAGLAAARTFNLGSIEFAPDGLPKREIRVSMPSILELFDQAEATVGYARLPRAMQHQILARAIGRIIAHEVGHFILRYPAHVRGGLMAALHSADQFASSYRGPFALSPLLQARLRNALRTAGGCP